MKPRGSVFASVIIGAFILAVGIPSCTNAPAEVSQVTRGQYLVMAGGCNDCHTPKTFSAKGPEFDTTRLMSGHPAGETLPPIPKGVVGPGKWGAVTNAGLTAWFGPWGVSFASNLTPDMQTGIGSWPEDLFIKTLRSGKFMGQSRDILPPMPWQTIGQMTDEDLKAIFAYLKSLPPIQNPVPAPLPPAAE